MEIGLAIRTGYYTALNGNVTHNSKAVPVYDVFAIPEGVEFPYILISTQTDVQRGSKTCKLFDATVTVDIVTGAINPIGRAQSEMIAEQVENIINPDSRADIAIESNKWSIGDTRRESGGYLTSKNNQFYIFRKLLTYNHIVTKLK